MKRMKKGAGITWIIVVLACLIGLGYYSLLVVKDTIN